MKKKLIEECSHGILNPMQCILVFQISKMDCVSFLDKYEINGNNILNDSDTRITSFAKEKD